MRRLAIASLIFFASLSAASATCTGPAVMKDNASTTFNMGLTQDPSGNCASHMDVTDWAGGALAALSAWGVAPSGNVIGVNAFVVNSNANVNTTSDGVAAAATWGSPVVNENYIYNGTSFDRQRSGGVTGMAGVSLQASPSGGASTTSGVAANSNNATNIKASAGTVYGIQTGNINGTTPYYLKLYDKATAPTCGTDTPKARYLIPPVNSGNNGSFVVGKAFTSGIGYCITTGIADSDNTSVPAATILFNIDWQ